MRALRWVSRLSHHNRTTQVLMRGVEQRRVVGLGKAFRLAFTAVVDPRPVGQPRVLPRLGRTDAGGAEPPRCPRTSTITRGASRPLVILDVHRGRDAGERPGSPPTGAALW